MLFWSGVPVSSTRNAAGNFASDPFRARYLATESTGVTQRDDAR